MANKLFTLRLPLREPSSPSLLSVSPSPTEQIPQQLTNCMNYLSLVTTHPSERMWNSDFAPLGLTPPFMICGVLTLLIKFEDRVCIASTSSWFGSSCQKMNFFIP